jgi:hypothetical protein
MLHADTITLHSTSNNPFEAARCTLIKALHRMSVPGAFGSFPIPDDFISVADHMRQVASVVDDWSRSIGHQVSDNANVTLYMRVFDAPMTGAIEGEATWVCEQAAAALQDQRRVA